MLENEKRKKNPNIIQIKFCNCELAEYTTSIYNFC